MSPRFSLTVFAALSLSVAGAFGFTACSSSEEPKAPTDAGTEASTGDAKPAPDQFVPPTDSGTKLTPEQCEAECFKTYATSKPRYDAVDTCWAAKCKGPCVDDDGMYDGGTADAGDAGAGVCGTEYGSGLGDACDNCTTDNCCAEWTGCYGNADCQKLDECIGVCYE